MLHNILCVLWTFLTLCQNALALDRPHIILILADDMGFDDVSFRGSNEILTPNIDALGYYGNVINRYYVPAMCTPSRAALLTGKYPIHTGMQHFVIPSDEPWGLPLTEKTMPEIFREAGYKTNMVGKWHLGFYKKVYTPTFRGFDNHFGYLGGYIDYWDHSLVMLNKNYSRGYDMRRNLEVDLESNGTYATDLFNAEAVKIIKNHNKSQPLFLMVNHLAPHTANEDDPMQAPQEEIDKFAHIKNIKRRTLAAMINKMDDGIGQLIQALGEQEMLDNSIIIFYSDNGAPSLGLHANGGSNHPLRGQKDSPWEGALRAPAVIWSRSLQKKQSIYNGLMHVTDWLPTLAHAANIELPEDISLDGVDQWEAITMMKRSPRTRILHNIDDIIGYSSYMTGKWKYVNGTTSEGIYDTWLGDIENDIDPRASSYEQTVLNSIAAQTLDHCRYNERLRPEAIQVMRHTLPIHCSRVNYTGSMLRFQCDPLLRPCLFKIDKDPCEAFNIAWKYPQVLSILQKEIDSYRQSAVKPVRVPADPRCDPALNNYTWTWWQDKEEASPNICWGIRCTTVALIAIFIILLLIILILSCCCFCKRRKSYHRKETRC